METTILYWGYIGIMEKKMEATIYGSFGVQWWCPSRSPAPEKSGHRFGFKDTLREFAKACAMLSWDWECSYKPCDSFDDDSGSSDEDTAAVSNVKNRL